MISKWIFEEALRESFKDWHNRQTVHESEDAGYITIPVTTKLTIPSNYAKAILKDVLAEEAEGCKT